MQFSERPSDKYIITLTWRQIEGFCLGFLNSRSDLGLKAILHHLEVKVLTRTMTVWMRRRMPVWMSFSMTLRHELDTASSRKIKFAILSVDFSRQLNGLGHRCKSFAVSENRRTR